MIRKLIVRILTIVTFIIIRQINWVCQEKNALKIIRQAEKNRV
jgi:hypothetical protein